MEQEINEKFDIECGCKILVQGQIVFILKVCDTHAREKNNKIFMNMGRMKTGKGTNLK